MDKVVNVVIPKHYLDDNSIFHINPRGKFILGGPQVIILILSSIDSVILLTYF